MAGLKQCLLGMGNPLLDIIADVDDAFLAKYEVRRKKDEEIAREGGAACAICRHRLCGIAHIRLGLSEAGGSAGGCATPPPPPINVPSRAPIPGGKALC